MRPPCDQIRMPKMQFFQNVSYRFHLGFFTWFPQAMHVAAQGRKMYGRKNPNFVKYFCDGWYALNNTWG